MIIYTETYNRIVNEQKCIADKKGNILVINESFMMLSTDGEEKQRIKSNPI